MSLLFQKDVTSLPSESVRQKSLQEKKETFFSSSPVLLGKFIYPACYTTRAQNSNKTKIEKTNEKCRNETLQKS
jgi:hypothetical protein